MCGWWTTLLFMSRWRGIFLQNNEFDDDNHNGNGNKHPTVVQIMVRELFGRLGAEMQVDTVFWMSCMRHKQSRWTNFQNNDCDDNNYIANSYTHCVNGNNHRTVQIMVCELCGRLGAEMQVARMFWLPRMFRKATPEQRQLLCLIV